jgi:hypothetical protein
MSDVIDWTSLTMTTRHPKRDKSDAASEIQPEGGVTSPDQEASGGRGTMPGSEETIFRNITRWEAPRKPPKTKRKPATTKTGRPKRT